jgi:hypothetical protein
MMYAISRVRLFLLSQEGIRTRKVAVIARGFRLCHLMFYIHFVEDEWMDSPVIHTQTTWVDKIQPARSRNSTLPAVVFIISTLER